MRVPAGFERLEGAGPFADAAGPVYARDGVFGLRVQERHLNAGGTCHGGLLATLVDLSMGRAVHAAVAEDGRRFATVSLTTDYLGAVREGEWVESRVEVERLGGTLAFVDCSLRVDEREVVRGRAVFAVASS
jgi:uncharacterized protein (TIGR00369 family)